MPRNRYSHKVKQVPHDTYLRRFEAKVPRNELAVALEGVKDNDRVVNFVEHLTNPLFKDWTMAALAYRCGLSYPDVEDAFRRVKLNEGLIRMWQHFPALAEDVARDARSRKRVCNRCAGKGTFKRGDCPECDGNGVIFVPGDADARKVVFETAGFIGKRSPMAAVQINFGDTDSLEDVMKKGRALIDAASVEASDAEPAAPDNT